jgi:hypothetical protein
MNASIRKLLLAAGLAGASLVIAAVPAQAATPAKAGRMDAAASQPASSPAAKKKVRKHSTATKSKAKDAATPPAKSASAS